MIIIKSQHDGESAAIGKELIKINEVADSVNVNQNASEKTFGN